MNKQKKKGLNKQQIESSLAANEKESENCYELLKQVELFLSDDQLKNFRKNENEEWQREAENTNFCYFWKHLKDKHMKKNTQVFSFYLLNKFFNAFILKFLINFLIFEHIVVNQIEFYNRFLHKIYWNS